jgi:hypothetical protein
LIKTIALLFTLTLIAVPVLAYQILLDIDLDDDPYTLNESTPEESALVRMILAPEVGGEWITFIEFGLGGTCWFCFEDYFHMYGTDCELFAFIEPWIEHPLFAYSEIGGATCIDCCGNPGFHIFFYAEAVDGGIYVEEPIFIRDFMAWDIDHDICQEPPPDLMAFHEGPCNVIQLSAPVSEVHEFETLTSTWQHVKALY